MPSPVHHMTNAVNHVATFIFHAGRNLTNYAINENVKQLNFSN